MTRVIFGLVLVLALTACGASTPAAVNAPTARPTAGTHLESTPVSG